MNLISFPNSRVCIFSFITNISKRLIHFRSELRDCLLKRLAGAWQAMCEEAAMLATSCDFRCWLIFHVPLPLSPSISPRNHGDLAAQSLKQLQCTAEAGREEPVGEGGAVPGAGGVEIGGEKGEDFGVPEDLGGGVGIGEAIR